MAKRMTQREKAAKAAVKKEFQEKGVLPPDKPKLNRRKFIEEAKEAWSQREHPYELLWLLNLDWAVREMMEKHDFNGRLSPEAVGAAKVAKLAMRRYEFSGKLNEEQRSEYTIGELYEFMKDIYNV